MLATPSPHYVNMILQEIWCHSVILFVSSPNEPKSRKACEDDDDVLDKLSLDSRYNAKKVMCGLMYRCGSSDDGNVVLCV
ncbi:hypothetical protein Tco_0994621 [Tanacetum coccineum]